VGENENIAFKNAYFWNVKIYNQYVAVARPPVEEIALATIWCIKKRSSVHFSGLRAQKKYDLIQLKFPCALQF